MLLKILIQITPKQICLHALLQSAAKHTVRCEITKSHRAKYQYVVCGCPVCFLKHPQLWQAINPMLHPFYSAAGRKATQDQSRLVGYSVTRVLCAGFEAVTQ